MQFAVPAKQKQQKQQTGSQIGAAVHRTADALVRIGDPA